MDNSYSIKELIELLDKKFTETDAEKDFLEDNIAKLVYYGGQIIIMESQELRERAWNKLTKDVLADVGMEVFDDLFEDFDWAK